MNNAHISRLLLWSALGLFTACAVSAPPAQSGSGSGSDPSTPPPAGQQFNPHVASATGAGTNDPRVFSCAFEYETFSPAFESGNIGFISETFGAVAAQGATAADSSYELSIVSNPAPSTNLSLNVALYALSPNVSQLSYAVLPGPVVTGTADFLFEVGSPIPPQAGIAYDGTSQTFDYVRAYCTIQNPSE